MVGRGESQELCAPEASGLEYVSLSVLEVSQLENGINRSTV